MKYYVRFRCCNYKKSQAIQPEPIRDYERDGLNLFIHRSIYDEGWTISEASTGAGMLSGRFYQTKDEAKEAIRLLIDQIGIETALKTRDELKAELKIKQKEDEIHA